METAEVPEDIEGQHEPGGADVREEGGAEVEVVEGGEQLNGPLVKGKGKGTIDNGKDAHGANISEGPGEHGERLVQLVVQVGCRGEGAGDERGLGAGGDDGRKARNGGFGVDVEFGRDKGDENEGDGRVEDEEAALVSGLPQTRILIVVTVSILAPVDSCSSLAMHLKEGAGSWTYDERKRLHSPSGPDSRFELAD